MGVEEVVFLFCKDERLCVEVVFVLCYKCEEG